MTPNNARLAPSTRQPNSWNVTFWIGQAALAVIYGLAGLAKISQSMEALHLRGLGYVLDYPEILTRFIGTMELLGVAGILLPAITRILPILTPLAALGFSVIQVLAIGLHVMRGEADETLFNFILLAVSVFVLWGRTFKEPIASR